MSPAAKCDNCGADLGAGANYCSHCGVAVAEALAVVPADVERRQLTVMFCDLVGSTPLAARLDPEEMLEVIRAYQKVCLSILPIYDGFLAQFLGDGVLAYFGYPRAHEDAAERAVRAGLDILAAVGWLKTPGGETLAARVGIATGTVVVGELIGSGDSPERAVVGDAPNLADRIKGLAEPGMIVIAPSTRRLLGDVFELRHLGRHALKGYTAPIEAWSVVGEAQKASRFEAVRSDRLTGFVGRRREQEFLLGRWKLALQGQGQVVLVTGEAGIGKSRLAEELVRQLAGEPHALLRYQCSPYHTGTALFPVMTPMLRAAGIEAADGPAQRLDKLERSLAGTGTTDPLALPLFAALLSIPLDGRHPPLHLSASQQRRQTFSALLDQLELQARRQPLLMVFEDMHWADATSLEFLALAAKRIEKLPVLAILTSRPEPTPASALLVAMSILPLGKVERPDALAMIRRIAGQSLPDRLVGRIADRSDGIPLFIEESTRAMLDAGLAQAADTLEDFSVPASLQDSLMARLDRLSPAKEVAQIGAVIGRDFPLSLLRSVAATDDRALQAALDQLEAVGLIDATRTETETAYLFRHALMQEAAYDSILRSRRSVIHAHIAEAIRDRFPDIAEKEPEVVARHFTQARRNDAAIEWWQKAGDRALRRSAYVEALSHLTAAIGLAEALPPSAERQRMLLRLHVAHGQALIAQKGYAAPATTAAFVRARELAAGIDDATERLSVYAGLWAGSWLRGELAPMLEMAHALLQEAEGRPRTSMAVIAHRIFGTTCTFQGEFVLARRHLEDAVAAYDEKRDGHLAHRFGHDIGVAAKFYLALTLWPLGEVDRAHDVAESGLDRARQSGHLPTAAFAHAYMCVFAAVRGDPAAAVAHVEALIEFGNQHGMEWWSASGMFFRGWTRWHAGRREVGLADMRQGMALCRQFGLASAPMIFQLLLAEVEADEGRTDEALSTVEDLRAAVELSGERQLEAEICRQRGRVLLRRGANDFAEAETAFLAAIATARRQSTRTFELRAAIDLAALYGKLDERERGRDVLEAALGGLQASRRLQEFDRARDLLTSLR